MAETVRKSESEWREELSPEQYEVLRRKGTERAFTGQYWDNHEEGVYRCAGCGAELFRSEEKYDSGSGWPSFTAPVAADQVKTETDESHGMIKTYLAESIEEMRSRDYEGLVELLPEALVGRWNPALAR